MSKKIKQPASPLSNHIGYHLRMVSNAVSHSFSRKLSATDVTVAEWVILREMYDGDDNISPSAIAEVTGLTRGAVSKLIERLLKKGLVSRKEFSADRRYQEIQLTPLAIKTVPRLAAIADENDKFFFSPLSKSEKQTLSNILIKLEKEHQLTIRPIE